METVKKDDNFIQFLGTGGGDFFDCHVSKCNEENCARVKKLGGRNIRQAPSLFITPDILIDFYSDKYMQVHGILPESVHHLLITHPHFDHFQPIGIQEFSSALPHRLNVYGSSSVVDALNFARVYRWDKLAENFRIHQDISNIQATIVSHGESVLLGEIRVTAVWANHLLNKEDLVFGGQALNFVFERGEKTLLYAIDSSYFLPKTFEILSKCQFDVAVFDASFGHLKIDPLRSGHQNFDMLEKTITQFRQANMFKENAVIVADHISQHEVEPHDEIVDELAQKGITLGAVKK